MTVYTLVPSPVGELLLTGSDQGLTGLYYPEHRRGPLRDASWQRRDERFDDVREQLARYFRHELTGFDIPLDLQGTPFQRAVWAALDGIGYGETTSYGRLAGTVGRPTATRAVAGAVARNPVSIVVPCHRVIGAGGAITGYAGGSERKRHLLAHETASSPAATIGAGGGFIPPGPHDPGRAVARA